VLNRMLLAAGVSLFVSSVLALPPGDGETLVREHCSSCHQPEILNRAQGYDTKAEWRQLMASMVELDEPRADIIARYLAQHFKSKPELYPTLLPGPVEIEIDEWMVPTLASDHGIRSKHPTVRSGGPACGHRWWVDSIR